MSTSKTKFFYASLVAGQLEDGPPLGFGDEVSLTDKQVEANQSLIDRGHLVAVKTKAPSKAGTKQKKEED